MLAKVPFMLAVLGMVGGVFIAILFGVNEDMFQKRIESGHALNTKIQQMSNPAEKAIKIEAGYRQNPQSEKPFVRNSNLGVVAILVPQRILTRHS